MSRPALAPVLPGFSPYDHRVTPPRSPEIYDKENFYIKNIPSNING